jgi:hypothetical protein
VSSGCCCSIWRPCMCSIHVKTCSCHVWSR